MIMVVEWRRIRRIILVFVLLIMLAIFYAVAWREREPEPSDPVVGATTLADRGSDLQVSVQRTSAGYFDEYRIERDRARAMQVDLLRAAAAESGISEVRKEQLTTELLALLKRSEREMQTESLLRAKGFSDAVVVLADDTASVVLPEVLQREDAARVGELVARLADVALERIAIIDGAGEA